MGDPCKSSEIREILVECDVTDFVESEVEDVAGTSRTRLGDSDWDLDEGEEYEPNYSNVEGRETDLSRPRPDPNINNEDSSDSVEDIAQQSCPQLPGWPVRLVGHNGLGFQSGSKNKTRK
ncbi:hypothetical protein J6590_049769 [Homalodisca vitripennis]|nr:hypothetical protein J6590_049769 [Homalodisca vitripennis]